ncbi:MAG TPA: response regulator transcription factor [Nitrospiraceae bacterium]|nr:response regulator transcription factor [Nitrospiraceae bacterium]
MIGAGLRITLAARPTLVIVGEVSMPRAALATAAHDKPDIILLDLDLYELRALRLIKDLKKASPQSCILILSGLMDGDLAQKALSSGAEGIVLKVQPSAVLLAVIDSVSGGDPQVAEARQHHDKAAQPSKALMAKIDETVARASNLTAREREIIGLIGSGLRNKEIAQRLFISDITVRHHLTNIFSKLDVSDRQKLLVLAHRCKLVELGVYSHIP